MRTRQQTGIELFNEFSQWYTSALFESEEMAFGDTWAVYEMGKSSPVMASVSYKYATGLTRSGAEQRVDEEERYVEKLSREIYLSILNVSKDPLDVVENLSQSLGETSTQSAVYRQFGKKQPDYLVHTTMCRREVTDKAGHSRVVNGLFLAVFLSDQQFISGVFDVVKTPDGEYQCKPGVPSIHQKAQ